MSLRARQCELKDAKAFIGTEHRHNRRVVGHRFSVACEDENGKLVGVCVVGRPVAPKTDPRRTLEVLRLCTDGSKNACSFLYGTAARIGAALGYERIQTFTLPTESGASLRAVGWTCEGETDSRAGGWDSRPGRNTSAHVQGPKVRWSKTLRVARLEEARRD